MSPQEPIDGPDAQPALDRVDQTLRRGELIAAIRLVVGTQYGSSAMLHRFLEIPRARADELILELEENGVLGPLPNVGRARPVLVRAERVQEVIDALVEPDEPAP